MPLAPGGLAVPLTVEKVVDVMSVQKPTCAGTVKLMFGGHEVTLIVWVALAEPDALLDTSVIVYTPAVVTLNAGVDAEGPGVIVVAPDGEMLQKYPGEGEPALLLVAPKVKLVQAAVGRLKLAVGATHVATVITCEDELLPEPFVAARVIV